MSKVRVQAKDVRVFVGGVELEGAGALEGFEEYYAQEVEAALLKSEELTQLRENLNKLRDGIEKAQHPTPPFGGPHDA